MLKAKDDARLNNCSSYFISKSENLAMLVYAAR